MVYLLHPKYNRKWFHCFKRTHDTSIHKNRPENHRWIHHQVRSSLDVSLRHLASFLRLNFHWSRITVGLRAKYRFSVEKQKAIDQY